MPNRTNNTKTTPKMVLLLDHDETIAVSEKTSTGAYVIQKDGSINATIMDKIKLQRIVNLSQLLQIPIHVVTARSNSEADRKVIERIINSVNGFHPGPGGFKREHLHFASIIKDGVWKPIFTKAEIIKQIHHSFYPTLSRESFLFVDDMDNYLEEVKKAGYLTLKANPETKEHFALIEDFILKRCPLLKPVAIRPNASINNISMMVLGSFIAIAGIATIALTFTLLNLSTLGGFGIIAASIGVATSLSGLGLFAAGIFKAKPLSHDESLNASQKGAPPIEAESNVQESVLNIM